MTGRVVRWCRGVASLALLLGLVAGVPAALVVLGGNPVPTRWDVATLRSVLLRPDDGTVLARLLALVGWVAWAVFVLTLVVELANLVRGRSRRVELPGLGGVQQWAAGLMLSVVAVGAGAQLVQATTASTSAVVTASPEAGRSVGRPETARSVRSLVPTSSPWAVEAPGSVDSRTRPRAVQVVNPVPTGSSGHGERVHTVVAGDDLWSLAEHYYGHGREWRTIATANPDRLTGGPDRLRVGWRLVVPEKGPAPTFDVRVRRGDTLSAIAARALGDAGRWREIYHANRDQLEDPDELPVGLSLRLPGRATEDAGPAKHGTTDQRRTPGPAQPGTASQPEPTPVPTSAPVVPPSAPPTVGRDSVPGPATGGWHASSVDDGPSALVPALVTVGGLLATALLGALAARRRQQLRQRALGRRIVHPAAATRPVEVELARRARPISTRTLDRATRAVAAACAEAGTGVPGLRAASVSDEWLVLDLTGEVPPAPRCFIDTGGSWSLSAEAAAGLTTIPGVGEALRPWPLLVSLGTDATGAEAVVDLETHGLLAVVGEAADVAAALAAIAVQVGCLPWNDELRLSLVGDGALAQAFAQPNVDTYHDVDDLLARLERVRRDRMAYAGGTAARDLRLDPERADAWAPELVVVDVTLSAEQRQRLLDLTTVEPGVGIAAVVAGEILDAPSTLRLQADGGAQLVPDGIDLVAQLLPAGGLEPVVELVATTGSSRTTPAPWWLVEEPPEDPPPDNVTYLGARRPEGRDGGSSSTEDEERRAIVQARITDAAHGTAQHPLLRLMGPVDVIGVTGTPPARAAKQCLEYCAWLLDHPGTTAPAMVDALVVAEGTRRSNMSRLRAWLGTDDAGESYLPDAYSGRIRLSPDVSSDWHQLQLLLGDGVDQAPTAVLELALQLVRGAPLADAAPTQWHWAEELRTDMVSCIRDIGVELAGRAVADHDLDLARWAASRALAAAPGDELLLASRIRTEHRAGHAAETERLCLQLSRQARALGVDLDPETVSLIQEVMEGRIRARMA